MHALPSRRKHPHLAHAVGLAIGTGFAGIAAGQNIAPPLPSIPGLTELQENVAVAVQTLCPRLAPPNPNGTGTERLSQSCTQMVVTAAYNQGNAGAFPPGAAAFDMAITDEQLAVGLQAIAPVQANAQKQMSVESAKMGLISGRLLDLRSGARGFTVGSNGLNRSTADSAMRRDVRTARAGATGGGAAADSELAGRLGGFLNVSYSWGNVDQTTEQDPYDYDSYTILAGIDYRVSDALVIGGTINYTDTQSDYDRSLGDVEARTWGFGAYGTWYSGPWYVDAFVGWGSVDYDTRRNINIPSNNPAALPIIGSATASPGGEQFTAAIGVGRNYDYGTWVITPTARLGYIRVKNDSFEESEPQHGLGLRVEERTLESLQSALGARFSTNVSTSYGVFGPYFTASWVHEFENDKSSILSRYVNDPNNVQFFIPTAEPTSDYAVITVGTTATLPNNVSGFVQFGAALGLEDQSNYALIAGVRKQF